MRASRRLLLVVIVVLLALVAGIYVGKITRGQQSSGFMLGRDALDSLFATRLPDVDDKVQALSQWQGKTLVINFWATWCPPCREEMPAFSRLQEKYAANGVQFVGIAIDHADNVKKYVRQFGTAYPLLIGDATGADLTRILGNAQQALPYTLVLNGRNEVLLRHLGQVSESELDTLLRTASGSR